MEWVILSLWRFRDGSVADYQRDLPDMESSMDYRSEMDFIDRHQRFYAIFVHNLDITSTLRTFAISSHTIRP
jgi:hypothetical protein